MKDSLVIRFKQAQIDHDTLVEWILFDSLQQKVDGASTALAELADRVDQRSDNYRVVIIAASEEVLLTQTTIPSKQLKQIKQALPFVVEELLAADIETVHMATPKPIDLTRGVVDVAVIAHTVLIHWLDLLHTHHLSPHAISVDVLCVPYEKNSWSLLVDGDRMLIRTGDNAGIACQLDDSGMIINALTQALNNDAEDLIAVKPVINLISTSDEQSQSEHMQGVAAYFNQHFPMFEIKQTQYQENSEELLANHYLNQFKHTLNLLQGGYRVGASGGTENTWQRWRIAASVFGCGIICYLLFSVASGMYFSHQAKQIDKDVVKVYQRLFPNERRIVSAKRQMQSHLNQQSKNNGNHHFLALLAHTSQPLGKIFAKGGIAVQHMRFNAERNDLQLEVQSQSIEQLDQFKNLLAQSGLVVDINSATEQGDRVQGKIVVREM